MKQKAPNCDEAGVLSFPVRAGSGREDVNLGHRFTGFWVKQMLGNKVSYGLDITRCLI